ncbi:MAG: ferric reductase-like transmembrane domain-containing protein [Candidatus Omnitrophica bacterium]|nr:Sulfoxide reductase heme-binding subunit YedZ [bacterium]NUN96399.1 ferric reductase-like transmembrane domain-containing protein [Candidatus Omnitrophota bacterium]
MSVGYRAISWNRQKRLYDGTLLAGLALGIGAFILASLATHPGITVETLLIRASSLAAFALLHIILCIGPLARLDSRFLPLLYNRRHLGVAMFLLALFHGAFSIIQFHALGDLNPIVSVFTAYSSDYTPDGPFPDALAHFPFEPFGAAALAILFLMAATSHDFWLRVLGASIWKAMHLLVYLAYGLLVVHVTFGALQSERSLFYPIVTAIGFATVLTLHLLAHRLEARTDSSAPSLKEGFTPTIRIEALIEGRGRTVKVGPDRVALFLHEGNVYALSNTCRHQGGPIGEGRILEGCITCPWHGWQYRPEDGCSPPPFSEVLPTRKTRVVDGLVYVAEKGNPSAPVDATRRAGGHSAMRATRITT